MNAERLLALYDRVADAPDAVDRLRRFVLDLAVRGKLTGQDPADEPVSELAALRKPEGIVSSSGLPRSWRRANVGDILDFRYGKGLKASDRLDAGPVPVYGSNGIVGYTDEPLTARPSVVVGRKGSAGALNKCDGPSWTTDVAFFVEAPGFFDLQFLYLYLVTLDLSDLAKGVKPGLSRLDAYRQIICVPPLAEQRRIVAKVDELMALCDRLEETRSAREDTRDRLTKSSLARLRATDTDAPTFRAHARFTVDALPALTARADQVKHLRQAILSLAVRGQLVDQDPADESASELLKRIRVSRAHTRKAKKRLTHALNTKAVDARLFNLPNGWEWTPLAEVSDVTMGQSPPGDTYNQSGNGVPLINGPVEFTSGPFGRTIVNQFTTAPKKFCEEGDLLICVRGSTTGRTNVAGFRACIGRGVAAISSSTDDEFIRLFLWKAQEDILAMGRGMAFPSVTKKQLENLPVPLPPLAEQRRIVAKVHELMALCDQLEAGLDAADGTRSRLLDSLLHDSLASQEATINGEIGGVARIGA